MDEMLRLWPAQEDALSRMHNGCILCGGTGSGKSLTGLAYYIRGMCDGDWGRNPAMKKPKNLYIITTAMKRDKLEWDGELSQFGLSRDHKLCLYPVNVVVDSWNNVGKYTKISGAAFIFDEQRVVGSGMWARSFTAIAKKNQWILLSATPGDSWKDYIAVFVANGFYRNRTEFMSRHVVYSRYCTKYPKIDHYLEQGYLLSLRARVLVDMDCVRGTERHIYHVNVPYDSAKYRDILKRRWDPDRKTPVKNVSELCYLLRKVSNSHPDRTKAVLKLVKQHGRCIIFYNFDYELEALRAMCKDAGVIFAEWNGHAHEPIPETADWVYLVNYMAGAEGWNCITCDTIIFYSPNYSYKTVEQASGRIDRANTPFKDLYYYHIKTNSNIDLAINRALNQKKKFNESGYFSSTYGQKSF